MDHVSRMGHTLIAYCMGNPVASAIHQFQQTLEKIRRTGHEIWNISDEAGIVRKDNRWYVWVNKHPSNENVEGQIYENTSIKSVLDTVYIVMPWLSASDRMDIVRQFRHADYLV